MSVWLLEYYLGIVMSLVEAHITLVTWTVLIGGVCYFINKNIFAYSKKIDSKVAMVGLFAVSSIPVSVAVIMPSMYRPISDLMSNDITVFTAAVLEPLLVCVVPWISMLNKNNIHNNAGHS